MTDLIGTNAKFKQQYRNYFIFSLMAASIIHVAFLLTLPGLSQYTFPEVRVNEFVPDVPIEVLIPPPPPKIAKPAVPVEAEEPIIDQDATIGSTVLEPDISIDIGLDDTQWITPTYIQRDIEPRLSKHSVVYPELLKKMGIEGTAVLWLLINEEGHVEKVLLNKSSGNAALDDAAIRGYQHAIFTPAYKGDIPVKVWVSQPVAFRIR